MRAKTTSARLAPLSAFSPAMAITSLEQSLQEGDAFLQPDFFPFKPAADAFEYPSAYVHPGLPQKAVSQLIEVLQVSPCLAQLLRKLLWGQIRRRALSLNITCCAFGIHCATSPALQCCI